MIQNSSEIVKAERENRHGNTTNSTNFVRIAQGICPYWTFCPQIFKK